MMKKKIHEQTIKITRMCKRMIHLKNIYKSSIRNIYKHDILFPRCKKEKDMEEHLFGKCEKLEDLYIKYNILEYEEVFNNNITVQRLKQIVKFIEELNLKQQFSVYIHVHKCVCA